MFLIQLLYKKNNKCLHINVNKSSAADRFLPSIPYSWSEALEAECLAVEIISTYPPKKKKDKKNEKIQGVDPCKFESDV